MGYSFQLAARVLLYAPSQRQDSTYHGLCYTSSGALAVKLKLDTHETLIQLNKRPNLSLLSILDFRVKLDQFVNDIGHLDLIICSVIYYAMFHLNGVISCISVHINIILFIKYNFDS